MQTTKLSIIIFVSCFCGGHNMAQAEDLTHVPVAMPIDSESAGRGGGIAAQAVFRVQCAKQNSAGTSFMHQSGKLITAAHVVKNCTDVDIILGSGTTVIATVEAIDSDYDLALLNPKTPINAKPLNISPKTNLGVGAQVSTWGFPSGYTGLNPMLSVGFMAGVDGQKTDSGKVIARWVVNAAFNAGNSGGPLLEIETSEIIGVVSSKLAPISPDAASALQALQNQQSGFTYTATRPDGSTFSISEGQVVAMVLTELRKQVQLVIGKAVTVDDLRNFLKANGVTP